jgi:23S rRNA (cytosine1962-C5)-methyltransferase
MATRWWRSSPPAGVERGRIVIADALLAETGLTKLYERSDASSRALEGLPEVTGWLRGRVPTDLVLQEHDWKLALNIAEGHKTGFYLDQRDSRKKFCRLRAAFGLASVLNCYCYTGGFTVAALAVGRPMSPRSTRPARRSSRPPPMWH